MSIKEDLDEQVKYNNLKLAWLESNQSKLVLDKISEIYKIDYDNLFIWEYLEGKVTNYTNENWEIELMDLLVLLNDKIYICITNEEYYPWSILYGSKNDIINIVNEMYYFEYFIFDDNFSILIFDTHHNYFKTIQLDKIEAMSKIN